ncbi:hypothetical protein T12_9219 [Trichinella patagoniensis]|uniref:Uncharacterized protein n=1 Tax=Trichinella patagoniensis TaxID=990121 RepID=A0A0V0ZGN0_9BILA|nr:hypothetical protein T12_9219 [Trichinella patagoniensis]
MVAWDLRLVLEIYDELASNASTSLATAAHFPTWEQARNTMYYSCSKRYPRLPFSRLFVVDLIYCLLLLILIYCWLLLIFIAC